MNAIAPKAGESLPQFPAGPFESARTRRYSHASLDDNPVHTDENAARAAGFTAPVVHGMLLMGLFEPALAAWRGNFRVDRLQATFLRPVLVGQGLTVDGRVAKIMREGDDTRVVLRLLLHTDAGELACIGEVAGKFSERPTTAASAR